MSIAQLKKALTTDSVADKYKNVLQMAKRNGLEYPKLAEELRSLHSGRKMRVLHLSRPEPNKIMDAVLQDSAYRSRCVEIINVISYQGRLLSTATDALYNHIFAKYANHLRDYSTKGERETAVVSLLKAGYEKQEEMESIVTMAREIINDIDQAGWSVKNVLATLEIIVSRSHVIGNID